MKEVVPERKPQALELAALRESIPATVKNKITEVETLKEAWNIMDLHFGDKREVHAKLKAKIINISLKATDENAKDVELFDSRLPKELPCLKLMKNT